MATPVLEKITTVQTQVVDTIALVKEPITTGVTTVVDFVIGKVPNIPAVPYADQIPTPKEVIDNQYKFAKSVIDVNKDIALSLAKAAAPITDKVLDRHTPAARKGTTATAAKKSA
ncbi:MAG: hypothetical protein M9952_02420 [Microthrixaceae bacterium]|nr:hypothetical protein [Microthrixaceae bacterium]MCO5311774.1 hypothetical protein [Microthrixaceae bacterium]HPB44520.1 hypothetical protein [Microthrixaceae bacterium]